MPQTTEQRVLELISSGAAEKQHHQAGELFLLFDQLSPIHPNDLAARGGNWVGGGFETGHPAGPWLQEIKWVGKKFYSTDDVQPILAETPDGGKEWLEEWGRAKVIEAKYRGVYTATMVYDDYPIFDYFRRLNDDFVMGVMETKKWKDEGVSFFWLQRA
ncbi:uncharacterized protein K452DRAFT_358988 [Aplosporella prunicola CBS 121167]|uniref:DUF4334 domain-containing protein n=1 Tax=Aplosporella prunicola CBS 121167 TaxID=1176127 RepID=A0A6A6BD82_9PEZI|nr:uncharacterized protein K452DRAFT_358988 [Aplosporella prunicola CBS 121167]KAF2141184.1 hypothetical protein K452DRAFT_358988 [Aplosporella prunicola CBS 121167]